jgi:hypothetical protein
VLIFKILQNAVCFGRLSWFTCNLLGYGLADPAVGLPGWRSVEVFWAVQRFCGMLCDDRSVKCYLFCMDVWDPGVTPLRSLYIPLSRFLPKKYNITIRGEVIALGFLI